MSRTSACEWLEGGSNVVMVGERVADSGAACKGLWLEPEALTLSYSLTWLE